MTLALWSVLLTCMSMIPLEPAGQTTSRRLVIGSSLYVISRDKSVFAPAADILKYYVDCTTATIRPKDRAIDKLFFVLFSFNQADPQPLVLWQCLASLVNMYSHVVRGMRPFVAAIIHMTCRASGHHNKRTTATASAVFAIEM